MITKFNTTVPAVPGAKASSGVGILGWLIGIGAVVGAFLYLTRDKEEEKSSADASEEESIEEVHEQQEQA